MKPYVFISKKLVNGSFEKIETYGSIVALCNDNEIFIHGNVKPSSHWTVRNLVKNDFYEDENIIIKKCELIRSKVVNK